MAGLLRKGLMAVARPGSGSAMPVRYFGRLASAGAQSQQNKRRVVPAGAGPRMAIWTGDDADPAPSVAGARWAAVPRGPAGRGLHGLVGTSARSGPFLAMGASPAAPPQGGRALSTSRPVQASGDGGGWMGGACPSSSPPLHLLRRAPPPRVRTLAPRPFPASPRYYATP